MWTLSKKDNLYRIGHIHKNIEIYLFNMDNECPLCKELVPDSIKVQKTLLNSGKIDQFSTYYSDGYIYLKEVNYPFWSKFNTETKLLHNNKANDEYINDIASLLTEFGHCVRIK